MEFYIQLFVLIPLIGFILSIIVPNKEKLISWISLSTVGIHLFFTLGFICFWSMNDHQPINLKEFSIKQ